MPLDSTDRSTRKVATMPEAARQETHTLSILVDNEPGVLARVIGLFSGRGYNIESLTVAEVDAGGHVSRITIVTTGTPMIIEQIKAQLDRLVPVHRVSDLTVNGPSRRARTGAGQGQRPGREAGGSTAHRRHLPRPRRRIRPNESFVFEIVGKTTKLNAFVGLMRPLGLIDVARTGVVAIARGAGTAVIRPSKDRAPTTTSREGA